jgi:hypothetical protein
VKFLSPVVRLCGQIGQHGVIKVAIIVADATIAKQPVVNMTINHSQ